VALLLKKARMSGQAGLEHELQSSAAEVARMILKNGLECSFGPNLPLFESVLI